MKRVGSIATPFNHRGVFHFQCNETAGQVFRDNLCGAQIDMAGGVSPVSYGGPQYSMRVAAVTNGAAPWSNFGVAGLLSGSGVLYTYSCADYNYDQALFNVTDTPVGGDAQGLLFYCEAFTASGTLIKVGTGNTKYVGKYLTDATKNFLTLGRVGYCAAIPFGVDNATCVIALHNGEIIELDYRDAAEGQSANSIWRRTDYWKTTTNTIGIRGVDAFVMGARFDPTATIPNRTKMLACANWHYVNAPKGDKRIWSGWA